MSEKEYVLTILNEIADKLDAYCVGDGSDSDPWWMALPKTATIIRETVRKHLGER